MACLSGGYAAKAMQRSIFSSGGTTRFPDLVRGLRRTADGDSRLKLAGLYEQTEVS